MATELIKLSDILCSGDMGIRTADRFEEENAAGTFDYSKDVVSGVIIEGFNKADNLDDFISFMDYSIIQLTKARDYVKTRDRANTNWKSLDNGNQ